jgi:hypothetical protein
MADFTLYPANDFAKFLTGVKDINSSTGALSDTPSTATITAFFSTANLPTSTASDPSLSVNAVWISGNKWLIFFDASVLTYTLLDSTFGSSAPYLIVDYNNGFREYFAGEYSASRAGTVG